MSASSSAASSPVLAAQRSAALRGGTTARLAVGQPAHDRGSVFRGLVLYPVLDAREGAEAVALLRAAPELQGATHQIAAFVAEDKAHWADDDGEDRAGARLRGTLKRHKVLGAAVVVGRWWGGENLGKRRFEHIEERCAALLQGIGQQPGAKLSELRWGAGGHALGGEPVPALNKRKASQGADNLDAVAQRRRLLAQAAQRRMDETLATGIATAKPSTTREINIAGSTGAGAGSSSSSSSSSLRSSSSSSSSNNSSCSSTGTSTSTTFSDVKNARAGSSSSSSATRSSSPLAREHETPGPAVSASSSSSAPRSPPRASAARHVVDLS